MVRKGVGTGVVKGEESKMNLLWEKCGKTEGVYVRGRSVHLGKEHTSGKECTYGKECTSGKEH